MGKATKRLTERLRGGLTSMAERLAQFEARTRREYQRQREASRLGPFTYYARIRQAYARLELPYGARTAEVRMSYRRLMRRYHPDRHTDATEKEELATEISQKLTAAYQLLLDHLGK